MPPVASAALPVGLTASRAVRRANYRARAFQHNDAGEARGQRARGGEPVALHGGDIAAEQPRRFERVRRQHARIALCSAGGDLCGKRRIIRDQVQCVGVQQFRHVERQHVVQRLDRAVAMTHAAADCQRVHLVERQIVDGVQHQFGMRRIVGRGACAKQRHVDFPGAAMKRRARCENRRAAHAGVAADHGEAAERALVGREIARREERREQRRGIELHTAGTPRRAVAVVSRPIGATVTAPARSRPEAMKSPGLAPMNVTVCVARTPCAGRQLHCLCRYRGRSARRAPVRWPCRFARCDSC